MIAFCLFFIISKIYMDIFYFLCYNYSIKMKGRDNMALPILSQSLIDITEYFDNFSKMSVQKIIKVNTKDALFSITFYSDEPYPYTTENIFERCMVKEQKENCVCNPEFDNIDFSYNEQLLKKKNTLAVKINTKEKLEVLRSKARKNDSQSMFDLALCYSEGIQVRKSKKNALCWFRKCYEAEKDLWFPTYALEILNNLKNSNFESLPNGQYDCIKKILNEAHINYKI